jgi:amidase
VFRQKARDSINALMKKLRLKAIVGPADARMAHVKAVAEMPICTLPLGYADFNGRVWGMNIITGDDVDLPIL